MKVHPIKQQVQEWAERGREVAQQRKQDYWLLIKQQIPITTLEKIMATATYLQAKVDKRRMKERTASDFINYLYRLAAVLKDLDSPNAVSRIMVEAPWKGQARQIRSAYNHYRKVNDIKAELDIKIDRRRPLPILTPENTLQASLAIPMQLRWTAYFRLRYETGPRPSEPFYMRVQDINFDRQLVRYKTLKGSGDTQERELPISPLCCELLKTLTAGKAPTDYVFTKPFIPWKHVDYKDAQDVMTRVRKQLSQAGYNVRGLNLYVYRHAFATRQYAATRDLVLVQRSLGHRHIEDTMIYIHLQPDQIKRYDVLRLEISDKEGIAQHIAEGWELAVQTPQEIYFKRPRWVP
jgi:integrase